jgi:hypothetical protein
VPGELPITNTAYTLGLFLDTAIETGFGVFDAQLGPKPAACALSPVLGGTLAC